jgi:hypothetical protein
MDIISMLSREYVGAQRLRLDFRKSEKGRFRSWDHECNVCTIIDIFRFKKLENCYTIELGFFSQYFNRQFGFPLNKKPDISGCRASGILGMNRTNGWVIETDFDVDDVGAFKKCP